MLSIKQLNNIRISLLFAGLVFSLMIFESGQYGIGLKLIDKLGWLIVYILPFFILESIVRRNFIRKGRKVKIFLDSLTVSLLSTFLWGLAVFIYDDGPATAMGVFFGAPFIYAIFLCINLIFSAVVFLSLENKKRGRLKIIYLAIIFPSLAFMVYGAFSMARCDFAGCANGDYLIARAMKSGNPDVCQLAAVSKGFHLPILLAPSHFAPPPSIGGVSDDSCYNELAKKINSLEVCEKAGEYKVFCYEDLAVNLGDISICDKLPTRLEWEELRYKYSEAYREHCYGNFYFKNGNR